MLDRKINKYLIFILFYIFISLISAYFIQYSLGYKPCKLCIYQRIPYFVSIFLLITLLFNSRYQKITLLILLRIAKLQYINLFLIIIKNKQATILHH